MQPFLWHGVVCDDCKECLRRRLLRKLTGTIALRVLLLILEGYWKYTDTAWSLELSDLAQARLVLFSSDPKWRTSRAVFSDLLVKLSNGLAGPGRTCGDFGFSLSYSYSMCSALHFVSKKT